MKRNLFNVWFDSDHSVTTIIADDMNIALDIFCKSKGYIDHADYCFENDIELSGINIEEVMQPTVETLTEEAKKLGIVRASGTYNGQPFWRYRGQTAIITRNRLLEILGYATEGSDT